MSNFLIAARHSARRPHRADQRRARIQEPDVARRDRQDGGEVAPGEAGLGPVQVPVQNVLQAVHSTATAEPAHEVSQRHQAVSLHILRKGLQ